MKFHYFSSKTKMRNFAGVSLIFLIWAIGGGAIWFMLPKITTDVSGSLLVAGLLISFSSLISLIFDIPIGNLIKYVSGKKLMIAGLTLIALTGLMLPFMDSVLLLLLFMFLFGALYQIVYVPAVSYLITSTKKNVLSEMLGASMSYMTLGFALGPVLLGLLLSEFNHEVQLTSAFYALMCILALIPTFLLIKDGKTENKLKYTRHKFKVSRRVIKQVFNYHHLKSVGFTLLLTTFILSFYDGMVWMLEPVYGFKLGFTPFYVGLLLSAFTMPLIIFQVPAGFLADKYGRKKMMIIGLLVAGLFTILFGLESSQYLMVVYAFLATTGIAMAWPSVEGLVAELRCSEEPCVICGVWASSRSLGYVAGPVVGAFIAYYLNNIGSAFIVMGTGLILSIPLVAGFIKKK